MTTVERESDRVRISRFAFMILGWAMVVCVVAQTFIAGLAIFNDPSHWSGHVIFVHIFEYIPLLMLLFSFLGRLPKAMKWLSFVLFGLIFFQYFTANMPAAGALHPVIALGLIVMSISVAKRASRYCFHGKEA